MMETMPSMLCSGANRTSSLPVVALAEIDLIVAQPKWAAGQVGIGAGIIGARHHGEGALTIAAIRVGWQRSSWLVLWLCLLRIRSWKTRRFGRFGNDGF